MYIMVVILNMYIMFGLTWGVKTNISKRKKVLIIECYIQTLTANDIINYHIAIVVRPPSLKSFAKKPRQITEWSC